MNDPDVSTAKRDRVLRTPYGKPEVQAMLWERIGLIRKALAPFEGHDIESLRIGPMEVFHRMAMRFELHFSRAVPGVTFFDDADYEMLDDIWTIVSVDARIYEDRLFERQMRDNAIVDYGNSVTRALQAINSASWFSRKAVREQQRQSLDIDVAYCKRVYKIDLPSEAAKRGIPDHRQVI